MLLFWPQSMDYLCSKLIDTPINGASMLDNQSLATQTSELSTTPIIHNNLFTVAGAVLALYFYRDKRTNFPILLTYF